jgi:hypothetical protein
MIVFFDSNEEIEELIEAFRTRTLPKNDWTHEAHLTVAIWFLRNHNLDEATCQLKSSIISYNLSVGGVNDGSHGYHETLSIFWIDVVHFFVTQNDDLELIDAVNQFLNNSLANRRLPFMFYHNEELLASPARARYLSPNKEPMTAAALKQLMDEI